MAARGKSCCCLIRRTIVPNAIPAVPVCTGRELTESLLKQIEPFGATFHVGQEVSVVQKLDDGRFFVETSKGTRFVTKVLIVAAGVGSFQPRMLKVPEIERFLGSQLHYRVKDPAQFHGKNLVIAGGGDSALDWAIDLVGTARSVTLMHRSDRFRAAPASVAKMRALEAEGKLRFVEGDLHALAGENGDLSSVTIKSRNGYETLDATRLLAFFGLSIELGPIGDWGLDLADGRQIRVDTEKFQTTTEGVFAIGDINYYPGKLKLILSGFHEAALASHAAFKVVRPEEKLRFQYTTSSSELQSRLQVGGASKAA